MFAVLTSAGLGEVSASLALARVVAHRVLRADPVRLASLLVVLAIGPSLGTTPTVYAADVEIRYLVERDSLRALPSSADVTIELHDDAACDHAVASETVPIVDLQPIVELTRLRLRGARRSPHVVELRRVLSGVPAVAAVYARVAGDGVVPVGDACQVQTSMPPPAVQWPTVRDANGARIGALTLLRPSWYGVLADDGFGAYALGVSRAFLGALDFGVLFPTADCSGPPFLSEYQQPYPDAADVQGVVYGPSGPPALTTLRSGRSDDDCFDGAPYDEYAVPAMPLDLGRFVPPFTIDHIPPTP
jgi:hypothetical protein